LEKQTTNKLYRDLYMRLNKNAKRFKAKMKRYKKRLIGTYFTPRISIFKSIKHTYVQAIDDLTGTTVASHSSISKVFRKHITQRDTRSISAFNIGKYFGSLLAKKGVRKAFFDVGGLRYAGRVSRLASGIRESGIYI